MTRSLVTGAAGFLGYHVALRLSDRGDEVVCVDNFLRGEDDEAYRSLTSRADVLRLDVDLADARAVADLPDVDIVFHMAALNGTQNFYERPFEVVKSCTLPTMHLLDRYGRGGARPDRFVYAGTSEAYASTVKVMDWEVPTGEDVPLSIDDVFNSRWSYAASKIHGEVATIHGCRQYGVPFTIIRYHNAYGPRMGDKHVIPDFLRRARDGVYELYGWEDTRSFIYVDDAVEATIALADSPQAAGEVVNVGGDVELTMLQLARQMMTLLGRDDEIVLHPSPQGSTPRRAPKLDKLRSLLNWQGTVDLPEGLRRTIRHYMA